MTEEKRIVNEHSVYIINQLSNLLTKEVTPNDLTQTNRFGLSSDDEKQIRSKIMDFVKKIES